MPKKKLASKHKRRLFIVSYLCVVLVVAIAFYLVHNRTTPQVNVVSHKGFSQTVVPHPARSKPDPKYVTAGAVGNDPIFISLPTIGTSGYIQRLGVDRDNNMGTPYNIHVAAWFNKSVKPGEKGLSIIDGHIDPSTKSAIFEQLGQIKIGDSFVVKLANKKVLTFQVKSVNKVALDKAANILFSQSPGITNQLNLITCGGTYDPSIHLFNQRIIIASSLVQ